MLLPVYVCMHLFIYAVAGDGDGGDIASGADLRPERPLRRSPRGARPARLHEDRRGGADENQII